MISNIATQSYHHTGIACDYTAISRKVVGKNCARDNPEG